MSNVYISKLTSKNQLTLPKAIRNVLHVGPNEQVVYEILESNTVIIRKASLLDIAYLHALSQTLNEWNSDEDNAYDKL